MIPRVKASRPPVITNDVPISRAERKARLEASIEQQRIDILVEASRWKDASRPLDDAWRGLMRFKGPLYAVGGFLLLRGSRKPGALARLTHRVEGGVILFNRARHLLRMLD
ncbi:YqjK-like family protein [Halomonas korlensis]|uniref:YqjK-like protein n=1 Tax=Halomonas korlensis TaxID=463301 RepID=A0A1I7FI86_9GAMM|nr:YqjK-like family protein [Halomonas korlensis]SFU35922.1 YqjK-like protein [Halomonas korlensis]